MVVFGAWLGWQLGQPQSDTTIITAYATDYIDQTGGEATDCAARPSSDPAVRMVIDCLRPSGAGVRYVIGPRGALRARTVIEEPHA